MIRRKDLEYAWIRKESFWVNAYVVELQTGKNYVVFAHDFNDTKAFTSRLLDEEEKERRIVAPGYGPGGLGDRLSHLLDENDEPVRRPFWYRGRIYELADEEMR